MAKDGKRKCPDCGYDLSIYAVLEKGDGRCKNCEGTGKAEDPANFISEFLTVGYISLDDTCKVCSGTGQCQTCGGTGYEYYYEDNEVEEIEKSTDQDNYSDFDDDYNYDDDNRHVAH